MKLFHALHMGKRGLFYPAGKHSICSLPMQHREILAGCFYFTTNAENRQRMAKKQKGSPVN